MIYLILFWMQRVALERNLDNVPQVADTGDTGTLSD